MTSGPKFSSDKFQVLADEFYVLVVEIVRVVVVGVMTTNAANGFFNVVLSSVDICFKLCNTSRAVTGHAEDIYPIFRDSGRSSIFPLRHFISKITGEPAVTLCTGVVSVNNRRYCIGVYVVIG